ncbi:FeS cluster assembly protein SufB [Oxobacter pfennigii]|uniref:FeS cluster assembly protein SufB n=1 Tax=Oxobacter pfennigii TaxID=36849 RepID=A0A0N8NSW5_9CLOT|nr:SufD family Fe-S cluster assembly protein [Oxobacter pfennigii]KPU43168.1 FeS cluster assembly protein SufB [Oxobacter pfennigii]
MEPLTIKMKRMPVRTWNRSRVNDAEVVLISPEGIWDAGVAGVCTVGQVVIQQNFERLEFEEEDAANLFITDEMRSFIEDHGSRRYFIRIPKGCAEKKPVILTFNMDGENPILVDDIIIDAEEGSSASVILNYESKSNKPVYHYGRTRVIARPDSKVKLIKVQMLDGKAGHTDAIEGIVEAGAQLDVIIAEMGGACPVSSCNLILKEEGAAANLDVIYLGNGERSLDMSYRVEHRGRKTVSKICGKGILMDKSKKVLRDTLDFVSGASGSKGREEESVLMLGPEVKNISVPLLLCGEDDVEGEHAATSGRPDDSILFYLMSRGISEAEAKKLLAQAAFSSIVEKIPDYFIQDKILYTVSNSIEGGGERP